MKTLPHSEHFKPSMRLFDFSRLESVELSLEDDSSELEDVLELEDDEEDSRCLFFFCALTLQICFRLLATDADAEARSELAASKLRLANSSSL